MRYAQLHSFVRDLEHLAQAERDRFATVVRRDFHPACEQSAQDPSTPWPAKLRVKRMHGASGIWEMTWSYSGPDGRATFERIEINGELAVRWRRIGGHGIFGRP